MKAFTLLLTATALLVLGCTSTQEETPEEDLQLFETEGVIENETYNGAIDRVITKDDAIEASPETYVGMTVLIQGKIQDIIGASAARIDYDGWFGNDSVVVVQPESMLTESFQEGDSIEGIGQVRMFSALEFEREYNFNTDDQRFQELEGKPVIVTKKIGRIQ